MPFMPMAAVNGSLERLLETCQLYRPEGGLSFVCQRMRGAESHRLSNEGLHVSAATETSHPVAGNEHTPSAAPALDSDLLSHNLEMQDPIGGSVYHFTPGFLPQTVSPRQLGIDSDLDLPVAEGALEVWEISEAILPANQESSPQAGAACLSRFSQPRERADSHDSWQNQASTPTSDSAAPSPRTPFELVEQPRAAQHCAFRVDLRQESTQQYESPEPDVVVFGVKPLAAFAVVDGASKRLLKWKILAVDLRNKLAAEVDNLIDLESKLPGGAQQIRSWIETWPKGSTLHEHVFTAPDSQNGERVRSAQASVLDLLNDTQGICLEDQAHAVEVAMGIVAQAHATWQLQSLRRLAALPPCAEYVHPPNSRRVSTLPAGGSLFPAPSPGSSPPVAPVLVASSDQFEPVTQSSQAGGIAAPQPPPTVARKIFPPSGAQAHDMGSTIPSPARPASSSKPPPPAALRVSSPSAAKPTPRNHRKSQSLSALFQPSDLEKRAASAAWRDKAPAEPPVPAAPVVGGRRESSALTSGPPASAKGGWRGPLSFKGWFSGMHSRRAAQDTSGRPEASPGSSGRKPTVVFTPVQSLSAARTPPKQKVLAARASARSVSPAPQAVVPTSPAPAGTSPAVMMHIAEEETASSITDTWLQAASLAGLPARGPATARGLASRASGTTRVGRHSPARSAPLPVEAVMGAPGSSPAMPKKFQVPEIVIPDDVVLTPPTSSRKASRAEAGSDSGPLSLDSTLARIQDRDSRNTSPSPWPVSAGHRKALHQRTVSTGDALPGGASVARRPPRSPKLVTARRGSFEDKDGFVPPPGTLPSVAGRSSTPPRAGMLDDTELSSPVRGSRQDSTLTAPESTASGQGSPVMPTNGHSPAQYWGPDGTAMPRALPEMAVVAEAWEEDEEGDQVVLALPVVVSSTWPEGGFPWVPELAQTVPQSQAMALQQRCPPDMPAESAGASESACLPSWTGSPMWGQVAGSQPADAEAPRRQVERTQSLPPFRGLVRHRSAPAGSMLAAAAEDGANSLGNPEWPGHVPGGTHDGSTPGGRRELRAGAQGAGAREERSGMPPRSVSFDDPQRGLSRQRVTSPQKSVSWGWIEVQEIPRRHKFPLPGLPGRPPGEKPAASWRPSEPLTALSLAADVLRRPAAASRVSVSPAHRRARSSFDDMTGPRLDPQARMQRPREALLSSLKAVDVLTPPVASSKPSREAVHPMHPLDGTGEGCSELLALQQTPPPVESLAILQKAKSKKGRDLTS